MRGPIRTPILLRFGNCNTPAEPQRAVPWAVKPGHACCAKPRLGNRASLAMPAVPQQILPNQSRRAWPPSPEYPTPDLA
jgi:hypothetical protein